MDMALHLKGVGGTEHMAKFFVLAWGLWGRRNKFIYEKILIDKVMIVKELYQDFSNSSGSSMKQKCSCQPPADDYLKSSVDDTIFFDHNKAVIRVILKNNKRETIMASSLLENEVYNPEAIETLVIFRGLQLCAHQGIPKIIVESDCLLVIKELQKIEDSFSALGNLIVMSLCSFFGREML